MRLRLIFKTFFQTVIYMIVKPLDCIFAIFMLSPRTVLFLKFAAFDFEPFQTSEVVRILFKFRISHPIIFSFFLVDLSELEIFLNFIQFPIQAREDAIDVFEILNVKLKESDFLSDLQKENLALQLLCLH
jgi:hypothetical protein